MYVDYHGYKVFESGIILGKRGKPLYCCKTDKGYVLVRLFINKTATSKTRSPYTCRMFLGTTCR